MALGSDQERWLTRALITGTVLLWGVLPLGVGLVLAQNISTTQLVEEPYWIDFESTPQETTIQVETELQWSVESVLVAPPWDGTISGVFVEVGDVLQSGDPVIEVDGITRPYAHLAQPFYRSLCQHDSGRDAQLLNDLLREWGHEHADDDRVTLATIRGVRSLGHGLGVPRARYVDCFDPAWLVTSPSPEFVVGSLGVVLGAPAPPHGTSVAVMDPQLVAANLHGKASTAIEMRSQGYSDVSIGGVPMGELGVDGALLTSLSQIRDQVELMEPYVVATLVREVAEHEWVIPSSALHGEGGSTCVVVRTAGSEVSAVPVTVVSRQNGAVVVDAGSTDGEQLLIGVMPEGLVCPSP